MTFLRLTEATTEAAGDISRLLPQLSDRPHPFSLADLEAMLASDRCLLYCVRDEQSCRIVGMLPFAGYLIPTGEKWQLEDVVLDASLRGQGLARRFVAWAVEQLRRDHPAAPVYLTSRPSRVAANALYRSLGFQQRETNVYSIPALPPNP